MVDIVTLLVDTGILVALCYMLYKDYKEGKDD